MKRFEKRSMVVLLTGASLGLLALAAGCGDASIGDAPFVQSALDPNGSGGGSVSSGNEVCQRRVPALPRNDRRGSGGQGEIGGQNGAGGKHDEGGAGGEGGSGVSSASVGSGGCSAPGECPPDPCVDDPPDECGDGFVTGSELCDTADPASPCCADDCSGPAPSGTSCGSAPGGSCSAVPSCDGTGHGVTSCILQPAADGALCDDGLFCTLLDTCYSGVCVGSFENPCAGPDGDVDCSESCNEASNDCTAPDPDTTACNDDLFCTEIDYCDQGVCVGSGGPCPHLDLTDCSESCDEATDSCTAIDPNGVDCDDGLFCTAFDSCTAGVCIGANNPCPGLDADSDCSEQCNELSDSCTGNDPAGTVCDDGVECPIPDTCNGAGVCIAGACLN